MRDDPKKKSFTTHLNVATQSLGIILKGLIDDVYLIVIFRFLEEKKSVLSFKNGANDWPQPWADRVGDFVQTLLCRLVYRWAGSCRLWTSCRWTLSLQWLFFLWEQEMTSPGHSTGAGWVYALLVLDFCCGVVEVEDSTEFDPLHIPVTVTGAGCVTFKRVPIIMDLSWLCT